MPKKSDLTRKTKIDVSEQEWEKIKTEYITSEISYRNMATKYGIPYGRLQMRGREEDWKGQRAEYKENLLKKSIDLICDEQAHRIARAVMIGDKMLEKVEESLNEIDMMLCRTVTTKKGFERDDEGHVLETSTSTEDFTKKKVAIDRQGLKQLSSILRDLREIGIFRSELDKREQEARIEKLRKDVEEEQKDTNITVTFANNLDEYAE
jgi:hypothetical protein